MAGTKTDLVELDPDEPIWERIYTISPLVVIGTRGESGYNLAPKHMAFPLAWTGYFGFVCTPRHRTYWYAKDQGAFTVSYPRPDQVTLTALAASPRDEEGASKPVVERLTDAFDQLGFETTRVPGRDTGGYLYARPRDRSGNKPLQLLLGHCDTVWDEGTLTRRPIRREDGRLYAPGAFDMKRGWYRDFTRCGRCGHWASHSRSRPPF